MADNMLTQVTGKGVIKPLKGILLVIAIVSAMFLLWLVLEYLKIYAGFNSVIASILLYGLIVIMFLYVLRRFCIVHMYTMDGVKLLLYTVYIKNPRFSRQILFRECVFFGDPVTAARKFAITRTYSYLGRRDVYATQSLIYKENKKYYQILMTPNEQLCAAILEAVKKA